MKRHGGADTWEAIAEVRRDTKRVRDVGPARMRLADDPIERLHRLAAKRSATSPVPSPASIKLVRPASDSPALRIASDDATDTRPGAFGYYSQFADEDEPKAVNE